MFAVALLPCALGNLLIVLLMLSFAGVIDVKDPQREAALRSASYSCFDRAQAEHDDVAVRTCADEYLAHIREWHPRPAFWGVAAIILLGAGLLPGLLIGAIVHNDRFIHGVVGSMLGWGLGTILMPFAVWLTVLFAWPDAPERGLGAARVMSISWWFFVIGGAPPLSFLGGGFGVLAGRLRDRVLSRT